MRIALWAFFLLIPVCSGIGWSSNASAQSCTPYARVVESKNSSFPVGYGVCIGQQPSLTPDTPVRVACLSGLDSFWAKRPEDLQRCLSSRLPARRCSSDMYVLCDRSRAEDARKPTLVKPYGHALRGSSLALAWQPIPKAVSYEATLLTDRPYTATTNSTELLASSTFPPLPSGQTVQVVIRAFDPQKKELGHSVTTFRVLSQTEQQEVSQVLLQIERLRTSQTEKTYLSLAVLRSHFLVDEAIRLLGRRIRELPPTSKLDRLLADLYFEMGQLKLARQSYERAQQIAIETNNPTEFDLAGQGLRDLQAFYNQDPTNTTLPQ
ncbi:MAG: hypothetical protein WCD18_03075 [Thermosynechococcaceae cyanobacterium]